MKVVLVMFKDDERRDFPLKGTDTIIGRAPESELRIPLNDVSRKHCQLHVGSQAVTVKDLGSANGTYVNGRRVAESVLTAGDVLEVGGVRFLAQIDGKPGSITPHDLNVPRVDEAPAVKAGPHEKTTIKTPSAPAAKPGAASASKPGSAPASKPSAAAPPKPAPGKPAAPAAKPAAPAAASKSPAPQKPAAGAKPAAGDAPVELTEEDLFDLTDSDFDLNEGSWPLESDDDDDSSKDASKKGKK